jgi:hypothetical protein
MFTRQTRPSALCEERPTPRRAATAATRVLPRAKRRSLLSHAPFSALERRNATFVFNVLRTLFLTSKLQPSSYQEVPHCLKYSENVTGAFSFTSALLLRSWAQERKLTPLPSCACARFRRNGGYPAKFGLNIDCQQSLLVFARQAHACEPQNLRFRERASKLTQHPSPARSPLMNPLAHQRQVA